MICDRIADGESLRQICRDAAMPDRRTVLRWLGLHDDFAAKYARAREAQGDHMDDLILATAEYCTPETAAADRVKIAAYQWRAAKLRPKVYGDKITQEHTGAIETKDTTDPASAARAIAFLLAAGAAKIKED
jgi:hypothetical protein